MMDWTEITIHATAAGLEMAAQVLCEAGARGVAYEDGQREPPGADEWAGEDPQPAGGAFVRAYLPHDADIEDRLLHIGERLRALRETDFGFDPGALRMETGLVEEKDWAQSWKQYYKPLRIGRRLVVCPAWEAYSPGPEDVVITLDPGMAFGTGTHETTRMCAELLEQTVKTGDIVVDVGCGSGILAITAAKLGASRVHALDSDPVAVRTARENAAQNGAAQAVSVSKSDLLLQLPPMKADVVVANIIADAVLRLNGMAGACLRPGGAYIVSGIVAQRAEEVRASLAARGFCVRAIRQTGEWRAFACTKT